MPMTPRSRVIGGHQSVRHDPSPHPVQSQAPQQVSLQAVRIFDVLHIGML